MSGRDASADTLGLLAAFIDRSPTPFHAVSELSTRLRGAGFEQLGEGDDWLLSPGSRCFATKDDGTLVAFTVGRVAPAEAGFVVLAAHTDSPGLRLKPLPDVQGPAYRQLAVEVYGSPLYPSWLDRDLGIAGRVCDRDGSIHLVRLPGPACVIPSLAIHLNRDVNTHGSQLNAQEHLRPIWRLQTGGETFTEVLAAELTAAQSRAVDPADILAFDLCLFEDRPPCRVGPDRDLLCGSRLDNLLSCHAVLEALLVSPAATDRTQVGVFYDHEEVGSRSASGAQSRFLLSALERIAWAASGETPQAAARALAHSLLVSVDMAHGVHPNWADKHDPQHRPMLGGGPAIKSHVSQAYATGAPSTAAAVRACHAAGFSPQRFASKNDLACGSTVGPITSARLAMPAVDLGNPMLAMHSCRELAATSDVQKLVDALSQLLRSDWTPHRAP